MMTPRPRASCRLFNTHVSHLAWCLVPAAGAEQRFAESDPKSLPAPAILGSSLTLTPENPAFAGGASFGLSGCPQAREEQSWEQGPSWTRDCDFPGTLTGVGSLGAQSGPALPLSGKRIVSSFPRGHAQDNGHCPELTWLFGHPDIEQMVSTRCYSHQVHTHLSGIN